LWKMAVRSKAPPLKSEPDLKFSFSNTWVKHGECGF